jgi:peptidoglycan/LPS O-acetylase OafA/YrhL
LYLIHLLVFRLYDQLCSSLFPNLQPDGTRFGSMVLRFVIAATAATSLAYLSRRHFEERFLRLKDRFTPAFSRSVSSEPVGVVIPMASAARSNSE